MRQKSGKISLMSENRLYQPEIDPYNGFEIVWRGGPENATGFTMLKIPSKTPFEMHYRKSKAGTDFTIVPSPVAPRLWDINGIISPDIIQNLNMPVSKVGRMSRSAEVTEAEIEFLKEFGNVTPNAKRVLFSVNLTFESENIRSLLNKVWDPAEKKLINGRVIPFVLDVDDFDSFIVPQKLGIPGNNAPHSTLRVNNI